MRGHARGLDGERRADAAFALSALSSATLLVLAGALRRRGELVGADDLSTFYAGPRALLGGADPYDPASWQATAVALGTQLPDTAVYGYPPYVALALVPLALVPLEPLSYVWLAASLAAGLLGLRALLREVLPGRPAAHALAAASLLLSWAGILGLILGQWTLFLVGALSLLVVSLRRRRPLGAGLAALALLAKPHLFVFLALGLAARAAWPRGDPDAVRADRLALAVAAAGAAAAVALPLALLPGAWGAWLAHVAAERVAPTSDSIASLLVLAAGPPGALLAPLAVLALAVVATRPAPRSDAWLALWLALTIAAAPYANSYDHALLAVPLVVAAGVAARDGRSGTWVLAAGAALLVLATPAAYALALARRSETHGALVPLAAFALAAVAVLRRGATGARARPPRPS